MPNNLPKQGDEVQQDTGYDYYFDEECQFTPEDLIQKEDDCDYELEQEALAEARAWREVEGFESTQIQLHKVLPAKNPPSLHTCPHCDKSFPLKRLLVEHVRTHTGERPFQCPHCNARFAQQANWSTHIRHTHSKEAAYKCAECERTFFRRRLLDQHVKTVHRQLRDLQCELCQATFSHPVNYKKHMLSHSGVKAYACEICGKQFGRAENRDIHRFLHSNSKPYICTVCNVGYMRKQQLVKHIKATQHVNEKIVRQKPQFSPAVEQQKMKLDRNIIKTETESGATCA